VHSGKHLISGVASGGVASDASLGTAAQAALVRLGVRVLTDTRADGKRTPPGAVLIAPGVYAGAAMPVSTSSGPLTADLIFWATTGTPNTGFLAGSGVPLDARGFIAVEPTLQVVGQPRIFAGGDAASTTHGKTVLGLRTHASGLLRNIAAVVAGKAPTPVSPPPMFAMLVTVGPRDGAARLGPFVFCAWLARMKSGEWWRRDGRRVCAAFLALQRGTLCGGGGGLMARWTL